MMALGLRNGAAKSGYTARDYVQDGLIAMWDGIENAGWGVHDPNATVWKDLSGNGHDLELISNSFTWENDSLHMMPVVVSTSEIPYDYRFIEVVYCIKELGVDFVFGTNRNTKHFVLLASNNRGITFFDDNGGVGQPSLHPMESSSWLGLRFSAACAYDKDGKGVLDRMFFNGDKEYPTGDHSGWHNWPGLHNNTYRKESEICSIRLRSRELTDSEVAANYAVDKARFGITR